MESTSSSPNVFLTSGDVHSSFKGTFLAIAVCTTYFSKPTTPKKSPYKAGDPVVPPAPLFSPQYGLFQEVVANDPWNLIIGCIFVTMTRASVALPEYWRFKERYPTPIDVASANKDDILKKTGIKLGFMSAFAKASCLALREIKAPPPHAPTPDSFQA